MSIVDRFRLDGKLALVTGAGRGIGRAIAAALAEAGATVTLCSRSVVELQALADEIAAAGGEAEILPLDILDVEAFERAIASGPAFDVFVNNAGTNRPKPLFDVTPADYDAVMDLNLRSAFFALRAVAMRLVREGKPGSIINLSSQMGHVGAANRTIYCASKWALEGLTKASAVELGPFCIRVNTICPTFILTPMTEPYFRDEAFLGDVLAKIKLGRLGQLDDVVGAAVFLASEASSLMTGSALMLDGGWTAD